MSDLLAKFATKYGPTAAIALFLVWWLTYGAGGTLAAISDRLTSHISETAFYMRQICLNTAQNETQRASCIQANR